MATYTRDDAEDAMLAPTLRHLRADEPKRVCSKCGKSAVQEVTVGRKVKAQHYFCFEHAIVVTEA